MFCKRYDVPFTEKETEAKESIYLWPRRSDKSIIQKWSESFPYKREDRNVKGLSCGLHGFA